MSQITYEIIINAPIELIWQQLLNFSSYPNWNPFFKKIEGSPIVGSKLAVTIQPSGQKPMIFRPIVLNVSNYQFSWLGSLGIKGIFDGEHNFQLQEESKNQVKLLHFENFYGILHKPILAMIRKSTQNGFDSMNLALKSICENK